MARKKAPEATAPAATPEGKETSAPLEAKPPEPAASPEPQKEADVAKTTKKSAKGERAKKNSPTGKGAVALVTRISKEAHAYLREKAGDEPVTRVLRRILAAGDARLGKLLGEGNCSARSSRYRSVPWGGGACVGRPRLVSGGESGDSSAKALESGAGRALMWPWPTTDDRTPKAGAARRATRRSPR